MSAFDDLGQETEASQPYERAAACVAERAAPDALDFDRVVDMLPRLGTVLWLHRACADSVFPRARITPHGVALFEHPALGVLADCCTIQAHSSLSSRDGLREWLEFRDARAMPCAKLFLLPDTDYWAWDSMLCSGDCRPTADVAHAGRSQWACMRAAFSGLRARGWQARLVRLPLLRLAGLRVLGLRDAVSCSRLSTEAAGAIAGDERAVWARSQRVESR